MRSFFRALALVLCLLIGSNLLFLSFFNDREAPPREKQSSNVADVPETNRMIFLHYHKTGHDLSRIVASMAFHSEYVKIKRTSSPKQVMDAQISSPSSNKSIMVVAAVDLGTHWREWLTYPQVKVVHFVRDPFDWTLSAYLYHAQRPIPASERKWMRRVIGNYSCQVPRHSATPNATLHEIASLCRNLTNSSLSLAAQLETLSEEDGLRLEAARGLLGSDHGDLNLMMQHLEASLHVEGVLTFLLSDFTSSMSSFESSIKKLCIFGQDLLLANHQTIDQCVNESLEHAWMDTSTTRSFHVTSNRRSSVEKERLKQVLRDDPVLGQPLMALRQFVQKVHQESRATD